MKTKRRMPQREPSHVGRGATKMTPHKSHNSPASGMSASKGPGPLPGAGMIEFGGFAPGAAQRRYAAAKDVDNYATPSGAPPKGMKTYAQE